MPTNIFLYDEKEIFCFFPFILSPFLSTILTAHIRLPGYHINSPSVSTLLQKSTNLSFLPSFHYAYTPPFIRPSFPFLPISAGIAVSTFPLLSHEGVFLVFCVRPPVQLFALGRLFSFKCQAFFISIIYSSGGK